ncbi:MAG TPA: GNAT family protein [Oscillatoriaceae cyanobacterium]
MHHTFVDKSGTTLRVRRATENDAEALLAYVPQIDAESPFTSREAGEFTMSVAQQRLFLKQLATRDNSVYFVALDGPLIVATIDFHGGTRARGRHAGEFGMSVRREYWGRGIGTHMLDTMLEWARGTGVVRKIKLRVLDTNERAIALYRSRGFVEEGRMVRDFRVDGEWHDVLWMGLWLD